MDTLIGNYYRDKDGVLKRLWTLGYCTEQLAWYRQRSLNKKRYYRREAMYAKNSLNSDNLGLDIVKRLESQLR